MIASWNKELLQLSFVIYKYNSHKYLPTQVEKDNPTFCTIYQNMAKSICTPSNNNLSLQISTLSC